MQLTLDLMFTKYQADLRCLANQNKPDNGQWTTSVKRDFQGFQPDSRIKFHDFSRNISVFPGYKYQLITGCMIEINLGKINVQSNVDLVHECETRGWKVHCYPFEVGCRGFPSNSLPLFFSRLGAGSRLRRCLLAQAADAASRGSAWVWRKYQAAARTAQTQ